MAEQFPFEHFIKLEDTKKKNFSSKRNAVFLQQTLFPDINKDKYLKKNNENHIDEEKKPKIVNSLPVLKLPEKKTIKNIKFAIEVDQSRKEVKPQYFSHINSTDNSKRIDPSKTFDNFIIGPSNNMAFATAKAVSEAPGKKGQYPSLYLYSASGLGKTHLLHSVGNEIKNNHPELIVSLITTREFMNEMIESIQTKQLNKFHKKYSEKIDVLMIDDIHELKGKQGTQNQFFHIFNELHSKGKQLIFTSDKSPSEIDGIEERIKTRLQWGLVLDIQKPDIETRIAIIKDKAQSFDLFIHNEILQLIAVSIKSSIRELEGCLIKLKAHSDLFNVDIDTEIAKNILFFQNFQDDPRISMESIVKATSQYFKVPIPDLCSRSRNKKITQARHISMYLTRKITSLTQNEIGKYLGGRDHSSVIHAVKMIKKNLQKDSPIYKAIFEIENIL